MHYTSDKLNHPKCTLFTYLLTKSRPHCSTKPQEAKLCQYAVHWPTSLVQQFKKIISLLALTRRQTDSCKCSSERNDHLISLMTWAEQANVNLILTGCLQRVTVDVSAWTVSLRPTHSDQQVHAVLSARDVSVPAHQHQTGYLQPAL